MESLGTSAQTSTYLPEKKRATLGTVSLPQLASRCQGGMARTGQPSIQCHRQDTHEQRKVKLTKRWESKHPQRVRIQMSPWADRISQGAAGCNAEKHTNKSIYGSCYTLEPTHYIFPLPLQK